MPKDREGLFHDAKQRRTGSTTSSRRSSTSTTVDDNGCIIVRGFVVPSRSSSQSSLARSNTSSFDSSSTPLSPSEIPSPGFARPVASSSKTPSLRTSSSASSLPRSLLGSNRPNLERRQTWQTTTSSISSPSSRVEDEDLMATTGYAQDAASSEAFLAPPAIANDRAKRARRPQSTREVARIRRVKSEQSNMNHLATRGHRNSRSKSTHNARKKAAKIAVTIVSREHADDAIASDSEDDDDEHNAALSRRMSAQQNRLDYATRRALTDDRNAAAMQLVQQLDTPPELYSTISTPIPDASDAGADLTKVCEKLELMSADSAIESDSDDDDYTCKGDAKMTAALKQAFVHREHNAAAVQIEMDAMPGAEPQKRAMSDAAIIEPGDKHKLNPHRRNISAGNLTVRLIPPQPTKFSATDDMPAEPKTCDKGAAIAIRSLRPSRTRPKPAKGVLKKTGSPPSTGASTAECSPSKKGKARVRGDEVAEERLTPRAPPRLTFRSEHVTTPGRETDTDAL